MTQQSEKSKLHSSVIIFEVFDFYKRSHFSNFTNLKLVAARGYGIWQIITESMSINLALKKDDS